MSVWGTVRSIGEALGVWERTGDVGCALGKVVYRETKRSAAIVNAFRRPRPLRPATQAVLSDLFPALDVDSIRVRTRCRLPANRFQPGGSIYAMTFGSTIYWRDDLDEDDPGDLVRLIHETVHVDQVRRSGGEDAFACEYGRGYVRGGGELPAYLTDPSPYHRNPLEAEAYTFEARFRDADGRVVAGRIPGR